MQIQPIQMPLAPAQGPIAPIAPIPTMQTTPSTQVSSVSFQEILSKAITDLNTSQTDANDAMYNLATGGAENLHDVMIAMEKAQLTLQYAIQVQNKVLSAYQSVMQMQV